MSLKGKPGRPHHQRNDGRRPLTKDDLVGAGKLENIQGVAGIRVTHNIDMKVTNSRSRSRLVIDARDHWRRYANLHPRFERAFRYLADTDLGALAPGRHPIDGDRTTLSIDHKPGRGRDGARLEAHRRYIDIQYTIEGDKEIGWMPLAECRPPDETGYNETRDIAFFDSGRRRGSPCRPARS